MCQISFFFFFITQHEIWYLYCQLWTYFTPCSSVSVVKFEHVIASWVGPIYSFLLSIFEFTSFEIVTWKKSLGSQQSEYVLIFTMTNWWIRYYYLPKWLRNLKIFDMPREPKARAVILNHIGKRKHGCNASPTEF